MRKCKFLSVLMVFVFILSTFTACGRAGKDDDSAYKIYCLNMDMTGVVTESYNPPSNIASSEELAKDLLERLHGEPATGTLRQAIPNEIDYEYSISGYMINVDLKGNFYNMSVVEQTLVTAAIVRTLVQIPDIFYVNMYVDSEPMVDADGNVLKSLGADSFVENTGKKINNKQTTDISLYFADAFDPTKLKKEMVRVTYTNKPIEKIIMEKLIQGPSDTSEMKAAVPSGTKIINSSILDGVCYVNLSESFVNNQDNTITEEVVLYSIVNSLCSIPDVTKVQITVNGDTTGMIRYNYKLSDLYEMDESLLSTGGEPIISTEELVTTEEVEAN